MDITNKIHSRNEVMLSQDSSEAAMEGIESLHEFSSSTMREAGSLWLSPVHNMHNHVAVNLWITDCFAQSREPHMVLVCRSLKAFPKHLCVPYREVRLVFSFKQV